MPHLVGIDVGTTACKAVVLDLEGHEVGTARAETHWQVTPDGAEIDATRLLDGVHRAAERAIAASPPGEVVGVGVASMGESGVSLDGGGSPLTPVVAWHDRRDARELVKLAEALGAETFQRRTGLPFRSQWSLTKHRWLTGGADDARVGAIDGTTVVRRLNIADWVVRSLGGEEASELSLASRTGWLDLAGRDWWPEALAWSRLSPDALPPLVTAGTDLGRVARDAAVPAMAGATLTTAGHDHQVAAIGASAAEPGDVLDSCGTAEALVRTVPAGLDSESILSLTSVGITVGWHALPGHWSLLGGTQAGLILERILGMLGVARPGRDELDHLALASAPGPLRVNGTELVEVLGIGDGVTPGKVWQAALDEVTAQARVIHESMESIIGDHRNFVVTGGWAHSAALLETKRRAFGPLCHSDVGEAGARGAALLAGVAAGVYADAQHLPRTSTAELGAHAS